MEDQLFHKKGFFYLKIDQLKKAVALAKKDLKIYYNKGPVVIQGILFPVMLFLAFTIGRNITPIYMISGLIAMELFLTSTSIGPAVFPWETRLKTLERLISCPVTVKTILLGNALSSFLYGCIFSLIPLLIGIIFYKMWNIINFWVVGSGIVLAAFSFSCFSLLLSAPPTDNPSSTMTLTVLIKFPVIFISPLFIPIQPKTLYFISPLTYIIDILNYGFGKSSVFGKYGLQIDYGILIVFGLFFFHLAAFIHGKTVIKRLK